MATKMRAGTESTKRGAPAGIKRSPEHVAAMVAGVKERAVIQRYLKALEADRRSGRPRDILNLEASVRDLSNQIVSARGARRADLVRRRADAQMWLENARRAGAAGTPEEDFVAMVVAYSERKGLTWPMWRDMGVPVSVLERAGVPRTYRPR